MYPCSAGHKDTFCGWKIG